MWANNNGTWKITKQFLGNNGGTWTEGDMWFKKDGKWHMHTPPNAVVLYKSASYIKDGYLANGNNGTANLLNRFIRVQGSSVLGTGGASTHDGSSHGASGTLYTSYASSIGANPSIGFSSAPTDVSSHRHSIASHYHSGSATNIPSYLKVRPYMYTPKIYRDAVILSKDSQASKILEYLSVAGYRLYMYNGWGAVANSTAHYHTDYTGNTNTFSAPARQLQPSSVSWYYSHYHSANHSLSNATPVYYYINIIPYLTQSDFYFDELPSGSLMLFTTRRFPEGWAEWVNTGRILSCSSSAGGTGGNSTHTHAAASKTTGSKVGVSLRYGASGTKTDELIIGAHTHTYTDSHSTAVSHAPPFINLAIGYKL